MKRFLYAVVLCAAACHQKPNDGFTLTGTLKGVPAGGAKLVVTIDSDRSSKIIDSTAFTGGTFTLKGNAPVATLMSLVVEPGNWSFRVFVENGSITIDADTTGAKYYDYTAYHGGKGAEVENVKVTGSVSHADWLSYQNDPALKQYDAVIDSLYKVSEATRDKDAEYAARDKADSVYALKWAKQKDWITRYIDAHPGSGLGLTLFNEYYEFHIGMPSKDFAAVLDKFNDSVRTTTLYGYLSAKLAMRRALDSGQVAPDFTLMRRDSSKFTLSSTRGHYQMIDFWASWCYPCRKAIPHWKEVYQRYHAKGFDIVSVSDDSNWKAWFKAMDQEQMPWPQVCDEFPKPMMPARVGQLYLSAYIPMYVLLDPEGRIVLYNPTEEQMDAKLAEIFRTPLN
jgi:thiol-disulfide isomerase/thioredoxin